MSKKYGNKEIIGDSACPKCRAHGGDRTGNHLMHWRNNDTQEEWVHCGRVGCGYYEKISDANRADLESIRQVHRELSPEEIQAALAEVAELPIMELTSRGIKHAVAERFGVRVGLSRTDGETPVSHYYPKTREGIITGYKVRNLDPKYFYAVGAGSGCDFFGIGQARAGDVYTKILYIFEDELSCMSGYQAIMAHNRSTYKPACVALPDGAKSAASAVARNADFLSTFEDIIVCMDNDDAGEEAVAKIRGMIPGIKVARIPKGLRKDGAPVKDANDMLMDGRALELYNALRFNAAKESPAGSVTVADCLEDALKKPEWGMDYPWSDLTNLTFGLRYGEMIAIGGGVGGG